APFLMPEIALDRWIPVTEASYPVYVSLWVYVSLPPALLGNLRALLHYASWVAVMCASSLLFFWLVPTQTPTFDIDWSLYPSMSAIKSLDATGNAFPSLHVASAVFSALWLDRLFAHIKSPRTLRWLSLSLCIAIAWSTVASRQHVSLDVLAGAAVGLVFALGSLRATQSHASPIQL
ncbi:MAG: phosphatase PAP2 family protein, partial [Burkholderiaceae bacterium]